MKIGIGTILTHAGNAARQMDFACESSREDAIADVAMQVRLTMRRVRRDGISNLDSYIFIACKRRLLNWVEREAVQQRRLRVDVRADYPEPRAALCRGKVRAGIVRNPSDRRAVAKFLHGLMERAEDWGGENAELTRGMIGKMRVAMLGDERK